LKKLKKEKDKKDAESKSSRQTTADGKKVVAKKKSNTVNFMDKLGLGLMK
jgi:hypothetical protein